MESLPKDMLGLVFSYFDDADFSVGRFVCKRWNSAIGRLDIKQEITLFMGDFDLFLWALKNKCPLGEYASSEAAKKGNLRILEWLESKGHIQKDTWLCAEAALGGHIHVIAWARKRGYPWDKMACQNAAYENHFDLLKWLRRPEDPCPWDNKTFVNIAAVGNLPMLQWAKENGIPLTNDLCRISIRYNHLNILQWAREIQSPWDNECCSTASRNGHLDILKWAILNGCPYNINDLSANNVETAKYLKSLGRVFTYRDMDSSMYSGNHAMVEYLHKEGIEFGFLVDVFQNKKFDVCDYAVKNHYVLSEIFFERALESSDLELLTWAKNNNCPISSKVQDKLNKWKAIISIFEKP